MNRLDLVVGPNGAGKSTFVEFTLAPLLPKSVFVNADEIAQNNAGLPTRLCMPTRPPRSRPTPEPSSSNCAERSSPKRCFLTRPNSS